MKINIFKCNKFNILSYVFCFSSFFNGSALSLYCVVITSLSLGREIRTPDSTPLLPLSFISQTHTLITYYTAVRQLCWVLEQQQQPVHAYHCHLGLTVCFLKSLSASAIQEGTKIRISELESVFESFSFQRFFKKPPSIDCDLCATHCAKFCPGIIYWNGLPFPSAGDLPQESNLGLLHCRQILYQLSHQGSPLIPHHNPKK